ncbi:MAG TPA: ABC transporter substrate-binding protein [Azospirillaceae bacterium]|nr:ABC transporter substrate-binding protein [Azospirillaceae bacterium]
MRTIALAVALAASVFVAAPSPDAAAQQRDRLVLAMPLEPPHLDPTAGAAAAIDEVVYANVFEGLTRIDRSGNVVPGLADSWTVSDDGLTYTFRLRPNVKFHDGTEFDSTVVKFSYDRARAPDSTNAQKGYFAAIAAVETPDPLTAVVKLSRPDGQFLFNMGQGDAVMVHPNSAAANKQTPVGTGPFRFERWIPGDRVVLVKNTSYWNQQLPKLNRVEVRIIADPAAQTAALLAGDVDVIPNIGAYEAVGRFRQNKDFQVVVGTTEGETVLAFNNAKPPFNDVRVRRAIQHAIDRKQLIDGAMSGFGTPIGSFFAPHRQGHVDLTGQYPYDPAKAKQLLAEAGFPGGFETTLRLPPPAYARKGGELVQAFLAEVGIRAQIVPMEWAQWLEQVFRGRDYDMTIVSHTEPLDLDVYARETYYFNYQSPKYRETHATLDRTVDPAKRAEIYGQLQRILAEDAASGYLFQLPKVMISRPNIVGMWENAPIQANDVTEVSWR